MLSRRKTAHAIAAWIRDRLQESTDRSLVDDTHGPSVIVSTVSAQQHAVELVVSVTDGDEQEDHKFQINVGMILPLEPGQS